MRTSRLSSPSAPAALAALLLAALLVLIPTGRAAAHDQLSGSDPASGSRVETLPEQITLTFSAAVFEAPDGTAVEVADENGRVVSKGPAEIDGAIVRQPLDTTGAAAGEYTVRWAIVSSDGHPTDGEFAFDVASGAAPPSASPTPLETEHTNATPTSTPTDEASTAPADGPDMESDFSLSVPWMVGIGVAALLIIIAVIVLVTRRRPSGSDGPAER